MVAKSVAAKEQTLVRSKTKSKIDVAPANQPDDFVPLGFLRACGHDAISISLGC